MGMYNYLNGEQVKCFPVPITYIEADYLIYEAPETVCFSTSGGRLMHFDKGSSVPYRSFIYNYGKNFIVYDYKGINYMGEYDTPIVHIIRDGEVGSYYNLDRLPLDMPIMLTLDNNGHPLNINSRDDFFNLSKDYQDIMVGKYFTGLKELDNLFEDYMETVRDGNPKAELKAELKAEYDKQVKDLEDSTFNVFINKWCKEDKTLRSNSIGWIVDCMLNSPKSAEDKARILSKYKSESKDFAAEVLEYKKWVGDFYSSNEIDKVLCVEREVNV